MASYLDEIPKFREYVPQLPLETIAQVGMYKQEKYEKNVTAIQEQIDKIAGLDVSKDVHKAYLQSKLDELGGKLRTFAAGDFSNFQLANSVSGMTKQIVRDPIIQNAVSSTAFHRKQNQIIEDARKNGKSSVQNETDYYDRYNEWLNDNKLDTPFTGQYVPYTNMDEKLRKVGEKLKEVENSVDIPYRTDEAGNVLYFKKDPKTGKMTASTDPRSGGEKILDNAMKRVKVKGIAAQKILDNFYMSLDDNDKRQLMIDAKYHYRGATKRTFQNDIINNYNKNKNNLATYASDLSVKLKTDNTLTKEQRKVLEAQINMLNDNLEKDEPRKKAMEQIQKLQDIDNIDNHKYEIYTNKFLTGLADAMSTESRSVEILSNPYKQMEMEQSKLQFAVNRANTQDKQFWLSYGLRAETLQLQKEIFNFKKQKEIADRNRLKPVKKGAGLSTGVEAPTLNTIQGQIDGVNGAMNELNNKYKNLLFPTLKDNVMVDDPSNPGKKISQRQLAMNNLVNSYLEDPSKVKGNDNIAYVKTMKALKDQLNKKNNLYLYAANAGSIYDEQLSDMTRGEAGIYVGGKEAFTAAELYQVMSAVKNSTTYKADYVAPAVPGVDISASIPRRTVVDESFKRNLPTKLQPLANVLIKSIRGESLSSGEKTITNRANEIYGKYKDVGKNIISQKVAAQTNYLARFTPEFQSDYGTLNLSDENTKLGIEYLVGNATETYNRMGSLDGINKSDFDPKTVNGWRAKYGDEKLTYVAERKYDGSGFLHIYNPDNESQIIPMSASELSSYFPDVAARNFMTDVKFDIISSPGKTTNSMNVDNPVTSKLTGYDIPGLRYSPYANKVRVDIKGTPDNIGDENDAFEVIMYAHDGNDWSAPTPLNNQGYVNEAGVEDILNNIGETTVMDVLNQ